jgi:hypothetical protein
MSLIKSIKNFEDYSITEDGKVYNKKQKQLKPTIVNGYQIIRLQKNKKQYKKRIHRLVAEHFLPQVDNTNLEVHHKDHNKTNNHYLNLEWIDKTKHRFDTAISMNQSPKAFIGYIHKNKFQIINVYKTYRIDLMCLNCNHIFNRATTILYTNTICPNCKERC